MVSSDKINALLEEGRIHISGENDNWKGYVHMGLEKLFNDWEIDFEGKFNVDLLITREGPWIINLSPNKNFTVNFIRNKNQINALIYYYPRCMQIFYHTMYYQINWDD